MSAVWLGCLPDGEPPWDELDDGIRDVVRWLWGHGFHTTDSGDGRLTGTKSDMEGALNVPHVFMVCAPDELLDQAKRLASICPAFDELRIQGTFYPLSGVATLELYGMTNETVPR